MSRGRSKRTWVKLDCQGVLHGSINWLFSLEEQAVFLKLIPMAAVYCQTPGTISDNEGKPLPREFMAYELHCPVEVLTSVIEKGKRDNSLRETEQGLELVNFATYQFTEYDRVKKYRQPPDEASTMVDDNCRQVTTNDRLNPNPLEDKGKIPKGKYGEFQNVLLTDEEYQKLKERFAHLTEGLIEELSEGIASRGYKYKSHYATILNWQRRKEKDGKAKGRRLPTTYTPTPDYPDL